MINQTEKVVFIIGKINNELHAVLNDKLKLYIT